MKFFIKLFVLIGLLIIVINGLSGHEFSTEAYINNLSENLTPIPRITEEEVGFEDYPSDADFDWDTLGVFFRNVGKFFTIFYNILSYPVKLVIWLFRSIYVIFSNLIWWA